AQRHGDRADHPQARKDSGHHEGDARAAAPERPGGGPVHEVLTRDNPCLSRVKIQAPEAPQQAIPDASEQPSGMLQSALVCTSILPAKVETYVQAWGGTVPASDGQLAAYLAEHAETLSVATLIRRLAGISVAHEAHGLPNPVRSPLVRATMRGIRRERGRAQRQAKPLLRDDLFAVLAATGDNLKDIRDRALLLIGFAGGFRRSELTALDCADIERVRQGVVITLRRSKTDQDGVGRKIGIPLGRTKWCPVTALDLWLATAG